MLPLQYYISHPNVLFESLLRKYGGWIPDKQYIQMLYYLKMGNRLNLDNPQTFSEKIQWLKLYNRRPEYTMMVDKFAVKAYVAGIIGSEYIIPTLGVWDRPDDIDFDSLPNEFVLKTTHGGGSGGVFICTDKSKLDARLVVEKMKKAMKGDVYRYYREWPYKNVKRRIIAEQYIGIKNDDLKDFKFFCFNGEPKYCQVIGGRKTNMVIDFFDTDWNHQPFHEPKHYPFSAQIVNRPHSFQLMLELSRKLSADIPFLRVDFYEIGNHPLFGELTFFPTSGLGGFEPDKWDKVFGENIILAK